MSTPYTASTLSIHCWAFGALAKFFLYVVFVNLLKIMFVQIYEIDPWVIGLILAWPRIIDALLDPFLGTFSDNLQSRWGRRRPLLVLAAVAGAIALILLWWASPLWSKVSILIWLNAFSFLLYVCYGLYDMTHTALGYELSDDYSQRTRVQSIRNAYFMSCGSVWNWVYLLVALPIFGGELNAMRVVSMIMAAVIVLSVTVTVMNTRERTEELDLKRKAHIPIFTALRQTLALKPFVIVLLFRIAQTMGSSLYHVLGTWIVLYCVCEGENSIFGTIQGISGIVIFLGSIAMIPIATWMTTRVGKRKGMIYSMGLQFIGALLLPFFAVPGEAYLYLAYMVSFGLLSSIFDLFRDAIMPDVCDLDELQNGQRREGLFTAVLTFVSKIENSICILLGGVIITLCGFDPQLGMKQPQEVLDNLLFYGFSIKILFVGLCFFIVLYFPLTQKMMEDVRAKLAIKHAKQREENERLARENAGQTTPTA
ncbi:MAG: MFS transporter [Planctomycetota bacterium]